MACAGLKPVVAIYSTFLQRAYDQVIHDVAMQNLPVVFAIDRAGLVGGDGATHNGAFDFSFLRCIPNMVVMAPSNENECRQMLYTGYLHQGPAAVRYPRGSGSGATIETEMTAIPIGKAEVLRTGHKMAILAFGSRVTAALQVGEAWNATVVNMRFVKPLDVTLLQQLAQTYTHIVTVEENAVEGGAGSAVNEVLLQQASVPRILNIGLPDAFIEHGDPDELLAQNGLDTVGLQRRIQEWMA